MSDGTLREQIDQATVAARAELGECASLAALDDWSGRWTSKRGVLAGLKTQLGSVDVADRPAIGQLLNATTTELVALADIERVRLASDARLVVLEAERLDLTERLGAPQRGHLHLLTQARQRLEDIFLGMGFSIADGPEVETDWLNFTALNQAPTHPARSEQDTFYVRHGEPGSTLLRTHTSPVQIRTMLAATSAGTGPPIYVVCPGRVFRRDTPDATHLPVFHQIEGLVIDKGISMADLAGTIQAFTEAYFGRGVKSRLRPSYFPFTEPSAEFDVQRPDGSWLELGGCGMVHPTVLANGGVDPEQWSGFAFGFGIDRLAIMWSGVDDIRDMYSGDLRFSDPF
jgi:phenylalanyl-tRNA synthetase alpha chain